MTIHITWRRVLLAGAIVVAAGMALAWSGIVHIGASTGHWAVTDWFLHWAMRNTVRTYALLTVDEPAADPDGLVSAAGHYAGNCAVCHGAPGEPPSPLMQAATPHAPDLIATASTYTDAELFWIIKHGIKFTGMPAWPSLDRDDEIRRMAAFVRRLPEMSAAEYRELAYGPVGTIASARTTELDAALDECERCHANDGRGQPDIPILAGQKPRYLLEALEEFATGARGSGVMQPAAARVDERLRQALAEHYASLDRLEDTSPLPTSSPSSDAAGSEPPSPAEATAASVVMHGIPELDLPPCANCHAPGKRADYPILAGQKAEYLAGRLERWRRAEGGVEAREPHEPMPVIARRIPAELIEPLARYFAEL